MKRLGVWCLIVFCTGAGVNAFAWGRRGHSSVAALAAYVLAKHSGDQFLKEKSFDLGYYANVPDFIWKRPATYERESLQHFMDYDLFERIIKAKDGQFSENVLTPNRMAFFTKYPELVTARSGRAPWRVQEFYDKLSAITKDLKNENIKGQDHQDLQGQWLVLAGTMAHYYGDMAQPLHCTENHDGEMTGQKGIHSYFEDLVVDELYPSIEKEILTDALKAWPKFHKDNDKKDAFHLALDLCRDSLAQVPTLLAIDKKVGRNDIVKAAAAYRNLIKTRLVKGVLYVAQVWSHQLGWPYDGHKFYFFDGTPSWIPAAEEPAKVAQ